MKNIKRILIIAILFLGIFIRVAAYEHIFLSEVLYDSPLKNTDTPYFGQYIELYNAGDEATDLSGWEIITGTTGGSYTFADVTINPSEFIIVAAGPYTFENFILEEDSLMGWNAFHYVFDIIPHQEYYDSSFMDEGYVHEVNPIIFQTQLLLPLDSATIYLKDKTGNIRDFVRYSSNYARDYPKYHTAQNSYFIDINTVCSNKHTINSIQRIIFECDMEGIATHNFWNWINGFGNYDRDPNYSKKSPFTTDDEIIYRVNDDPLFNINNPVLNAIITVNPLTALDAIPSKDNKEQFNALNAIVEIDYFDGLGRLIQTIHKGITPEGDDLIKLLEYDVFGRKYRQWLSVPYAESKGEFVHPITFESIANSYEFYSEGSPYNESIYENTSLLNYVKGTKGAGSAWNNHPTTISYGTNGGDVKCFYVDNAGQLVKGSNYSSSSLYKTTTADEDGNTLTEYKDKLGHIVMTRQASNHDTYYVYNDLMQLCYVLPPLAADANGSADAVNKYG